jgi:hypothetical protein
MSRIRSKLAAYVTIATMCGFAAAATLPSTALAARSVSIVGAWKGQLTASPTSDVGAFAVTDSGPGVANDLGAFHLNSSETDNFATDTITDGTFTIGNSRGDSIHGTYAGTFSPTSATAVTFISSGQITGGAGQLRGATGQITFTGIASSSSLTVLGAFTAKVSAP